ncbi:transmembrane emp24 domain-containing protein 5-like [Galendromus occidentalis]|uniref:Transmembrane emp24 domain-containing protein 5-like n=1 Tax=Galendromus occidentalis TaxID=34638 RepID=A0AAJ6QWC7_9ACAR|nr:transmembrane emp24 domain-containing protein 5-like [Galendromus occidentalis]
MALPCVRCRIFVPLTLIAILSQFAAVNSRYTDEAEFTIVLKPAEQECFFQEAKEGQYLEVEYQVLDANLDSLSIDFSVAAADGKPLVSERGKSESVHRLRIPSTGALRICLDNRPYYARKSIYIEVFIEDADSEDEHAGDDDPFDLGTVTFAPDDRFNTKEIDQMRHRISKIYENLNHVQRYQEWQKAHEAKHRNMIEHIFDILNTLSALQMLLMGMLMFMQVKVIEKFFQADSPLLNWRTWFSWSSS